MSELKEEIRKEKRETQEYKQFIENIKIYEKRVGELVSIFSQLKKQWKCHRCKLELVYFNYILHGFFHLKLGFLRYNMFEDRNMLYWVNFFYFDILPVLDFVEKIITSEHVKFYCCKCYDEMIRELENEI